jgi:hypothetical protein
MIVSPLILLKLSINNSSSDVKGQNSATPCLEMAEKIKEEISCAAYECLLFSEEYRPTWSRNKIQG